MIAIIKHKKLHLNAFMITALSLCATAEAGVAGHFQFVAGDVRVLDISGKEHAAQKGQEVNEGETVFTAANSSAQLKMTDDGIVALRPDTRLKIDAYVYHGAEDGSENVVFSLFKGGLRAITGIVGKRSKERYHLHTPTATIGIRGTDHEPMVVLPPLPGETATIPPGTYDKVNVGATVLTTEAGDTVIAPNQVGFAAAPDKPPVILPKVPDFYQAASTTQTKQDKKPEEKQAAKEGNGTAAAASATTSSDTTTASSDTADAPKAPSANSLPTTPLSQLSLTAVNASGDTVDLTNTDGTLVRGVAINDGWRDHQGSSLFDPAKTNLGPLYRGSVDGDLVSPDRVVSDASGLVEFLGKARDFTPVGASASTSASASSSNQVTAGQTATTATATPSTSSTPVEATIRIGSAVNTDIGSTTIAGVTVSWGRWEGGTIDIFSADGASKLGTIDNTNRSVHWLTTSPISQSALALPLTGTATYTLVGATTPTDLYGNKGTLNKATLNADFSNARVNVGVDVSFNVPTNTSHWMMMANNVPLTNNKDGFQSDSSMNGINGVSHTVTCAGPACGSQSFGSLDAHLLSKGPDQGAVITYSMVTGNTAAVANPSVNPSVTPGSVFTPSNIVSGLAVMKH